jgi:signal transduction histidine kinase
MKHAIKLLAGIALIAILASGAVAGEKATPAEVIQKVSEAVALVQEKGEEAAFTIFRDKNGPFVWKGSYLFVIDFDGIMLMHPIVSKLEGRNQLNVKDVNGKMFNAETLALAKGPGSGWVDYYWVKPGEKKASPKVSYVKAVPGKNMLIGCGIYDISKAEAEKAGK